MQEDCYQKHTLALNRTILELKHHFHLTQKRQDGTLNRTILELKQEFKTARRLLVFFKSYHFGIETKSWRHNDGELCFL